jgi:hypothetical protein
MHHYIDMWIRMQLVLLFSHRFKQDHKLPHNILDYALLSEFVWAERLHLTSGVRT